MVPEKIKITFILPSLAAGGAERVMSFVAQHIDKEQFEATLLVVGYQHQTAFKINSIPVIYLNKSRVLHSVWPIFNYLRKEKPQLVISAIGHTNTVTGYLSLLFPSTGFIAREVNILSALKSYELKKVPFSKLFSERRFKFFDKVVCQSRDMLDDLQSTYDIPTEKLEVINNPITDGFELSDRQKLNDPLRFITVARLKKQKGHERILRVLGRLGFPFHYTIVGDGPEKENLFKLALELGIQDSIQHIPYTEEVARYLSESDLYLQGAFIEGFPNSVLESCAVGTPVLAFDAPGGLNEIIQDGVTGFRVEDSDQYYNTLKKIVSDYPFKREKVSRSVYEKYDKRIILKRYEQMFLEVIHRD